MELPKAPDIPAPRKNDNEYMELWHKYLQSDIDNCELERECCIWRRAFYTVAAILFALTFTILVLAASMVADIK